MPVQAPSKQLQAPAPLNPASPEAPRAGKAPTTSRFDDRRHAVHQAISHSTGTTEGPRLEEPVRRPLARPPADGSSGPGNSRSARPRRAVRPAARPGRDPQPSENPSGEAPVMRYLPAPPPTDNQKSSESSSRWRWISLKCSLSSLRIAVSTSARLDSSDGVLPATLAPLTNGQAKQRRVRIQTPHGG